VSLRETNNDLQLEQEEYPGLPVLSQGAQEGLWYLRSLSFHFANSSQFIDSGMGDAWSSLVAWPFGGGLSFSQLTGCSEMVRMTETVSNKFCDRDLTSLWAW
jgi:hypothetical protein